MPGKGVAFCPATMAPSKARLLTMWAEEADMTAAVAMEIRAEGNRDS